jgi:hypothetical protein
VRLTRSAVILEQLNRHKRRSATPQDVQAIIPRALATADSYFNEFWTNKKLYGSAQSAKESSPTPANKKPLPDSCAKKS